ncbi:hypothetical protein ACFX5U_12215 [Sphingobacterium sp. SG20118]|uniref:hypothetical protein n=1 Tax=Sphingobacterium sp. SG20118 TaxID=3367156 RepID=UPI0037DFC65D
MVPAGGVRKMMPANLKGDSIRVSAVIKRENVTDSSYVSAMLRIDPKVYFENMASRQIRGTKDWENFTDQRLVDLARIWEFLKYRHPIMELGKLFGTGSGVGVQRIVSFFI